MYLWKCNRFFSRAKSQDFGRDLVASTIINQYIRYILVDTTSDTLLSKPSQNHEARHQKQQQTVLNRQVRRFIASFDVS